MAATCADTWAARMEAEADPMAQIGRGWDQGEGAKRPPSIAGDGVRAAATTWTDSHRRQRRGMRRSPSGGVVGSSPSGAGEGWWREEAAVLLGTEGGGDSPTMHREREAADGDRGDLGKQLRGLREE